MPALRNSLNIRSRVMWVRAFFNTYKRRVIAAGGVIQNEPCAVRAFNNNLLRSASWTLVPSGIEEDIVFAQKPSSGLGDLVMTRASDATYTDASGVVRRSPYNLLQQSDMFSNAIWTKTNSTIGIDATVAPNGTLTADALTDNATNGLHSVSQNLTLIAGNYTFSFYAKPSSLTRIGILANSAINPQLATNTQIFDLSNGTVVNSVSGVTASIIDAGNGWYRCSATFPSGNATAPIYIGAIKGTSSAYVGTGESLFIWGAQLVEGTSALDYFPTTNRQDVPRIDFRNADGTLSTCGRLLLEPQRTNSIRNSSMVGAVAGSPGTVPTNWFINAPAGINTQVIAIGTENGLPYIDVRYFGTGSGLGNITFEQAVITASNGQTWTNSIYVKLTSGSTANCTISNRIAERNSGGGAIVEGLQTINFTSSLSRNSFTRTLSGGATVAFVIPAILLNFSSGTHDFTIRIAAPQMELGAYATTWVPTTTAAVTRVQDLAVKTGASSLIGQTEGTLFLDIDLKNAPINFSYIMLRNASASDYISLNWRAGVLRFETVDDNVLQTSINYSATTVQTLKVALAYKLNDFVMYVNGAQVGIDTSGTIPTCSVIDLNFASPANNAFGIGQAALFPTRLTNAQLAQLTTL